MLCRPAFLSGALPERIELLLESLLGLRWGLLVLVVQFVRVFPKVVEFVFAVL